jgi:hypothetical protein
MIPMLVLKQVPTIESEIGESRHHNYLRTPCQKQQDQKLFAGHADDHPSSRGAVQKRYRLTGPQRTLSMCVLPALMPEN